MIVAVEIQSVLDKYGSKLIEEKDIVGYKVLVYQTDSCTNNLVQRFVIWNQLA